MNLLEERYRRVLRMLPASYRAEWEDEMVATFMDAAGDVRDEDDPKPRWSEIFSVAALAVRVRLGGGTEASPRSLAWGEAVRLTALLGLLVLAAFGCIGVVSFLRLYVFGPPSDLPAAYNQLFGPAGSVERLWYVGRSVVDLAWVAAYVTLVLGRHRTAQVLAVLAFVPMVYEASSAFATAPSFGIDALAHSMPTAVTVLALLAGFHRDAPRPTYRGRWLAALPVAAGLLLALNLLSGTLGRDQQILTWWMWLVSGMVYSLFLVAAGVAYLIVHAYAPARRTPSWPLALTMLAVPVLLAQIAASPFRLDATGQGTAAGVVVLGPSAAVVVVASLLAVVGARMLRPLPARHRQGAAPHG